MITASILKFLGCLLVIGAGSLPWIGMVRCLWFLFSRKGQALGIDRPFLWGVLAIMGFFALIEMSLLADYMMGNLR